MALDQPEIWIPRFKDFQPDLNLFDLYKKKYKNNKHLNDIACDNKEVDTTVYAKVREIEDNFDKL